MNINTILFDLDGTLINTNDLIIESFLHTLNHYYPNQYTREDVLAFIGRRYGIRLKPSIQIGSTR